MNAFRNVSKPLVMLIAVLMAFSAVAIVAAESSDAANVNEGASHADNFKNGQNGTLTLVVDNCAAGELTVEIKENNHSIYKNVFKDLEAGTNTVTASFQLSTGEHTVNIYLDGTLSGSMTISSADNIWSHAAPYAMVVIVIIIAIILIYLYMRNRPNNKPTTTFTQLEEEKKASAASEGKTSEAPKTEKRKYNASGNGTEKIKYTSSRRK